MATGSDSTNGSELFIKRSGADKVTGAPKNVVAVKDVSGGSHDPGRKHPPK